MHGISKAAKAAAYEPLTRDLSAYQLFAWHYANNNVPDATEVVQDGETFHFYKLLGCLHASGGLMVYTMEHPGQRHSITVQYFDDWLRAVEKIPYNISEALTATKIAAERLSAARRRIFDAEVTEAKEA